MDLTDEQMRIELKRLVEDTRLRALQSLDEPENTITSNPEVAAGATVEQLKTLSGGIERAKEKLTLRFQQMSDFIDRR